MYEVKLLLDFVFLIYSILRVIVREFFHRFPLGASKPNHLPYCNLRPYVIVIFIFTVGFSVSAQFFSYFHALEAIVGADTVLGQWYSSLDCCGVAVRIVVNFVIPGTQGFFIKPDLRMVCFIIGAFKLVRKYIKILFCDLTQFGRKSSSSPGIQLGYAQ